MEYGMCLSLIQNTHWSEFWQECSGADDGKINLVLLVPCAILLVKLDFKECTPHKQNP